MPYNADQFIEDVKTLVDYNFADEARNFEEMKREGGDTESHIFKTIVRLNDFTYHGR